MDAALRINPHAMIAKSAANPSLRFVFDERKQALLL